MTDLEWTIHTANGSVVADALQVELYTVRVGETISPVLRFSHGSNESPQNRWEALQPYVRDTSDQVVQTGRTSSGTGYYREETAGVDVDSFFVSLEPPVGSGYAGVWGVITGGQDQSNSVRTVRRWQLEIVVLAPLDDYADRATAKAALEDEVL